MGRIPRLREKSEQDAVRDDARAIARLLNMTKTTHYQSDSKQGQYAFFSAMHHRYSFDGSSMWRICGDKLLASISWDSEVYGGPVVTGEVFFKKVKPSKDINKRLNDKKYRDGGYWVGRSCWRRRTKEENEIMGPIA